MYHVLHGRSVLGHLLSGVIFGVAFMHTQVGCFGGVKQAERLAKNIRVDGKLVACVCVCVVFAAFLSCEFACLATFAELSPEMDKNTSW